MVALAGNAEPVLALIHRDLEDFRQNGIPIEIPNRNVDATRDLNITPTNEPEIDAVEHCRQ